MTCKLYLAVTFSTPETLGEFFLHWLKNITNDPIFGNTSASLFLQLKPAFYPFYIKGTKDSIIVDSVVLILSYKGFFGDSSKPVKIYVNKRFLCGIFIGIHK